MTKNMGTIICADDEPLDRELYMEFLSMYLPEFNIEIYENGTQLKNRLENIKNDDVAVITDNTMPGEHGSAIIATYANKPGFEKMLFLLIYAGDEEIGRQAIKNGADKYYRKPLTWESFCMNLKKAIQEKSNL